MDQLRCLACALEIQADPAATWLDCPSCGRPLHLPTARAVEASERVARAVAGEPSLDEECRLQLCRVLGEWRQRAIEKARGLTQEPERQPTAPEPVSQRNVPATRPVRVRAAMARKGPGLWARLGPVFAENVLFALAAFLLVAGAVYFTTTAWTTMSGSTQKLVVAAALLGFAGLTHGAGVALAKAEGLLPAARVLSMVAAALVPAATAVTGLLFREEPALAIAAAGVTTAVGHLLLRTALRREGGPVHALAPWLYDALVFAGVFAPSLVGWRLCACCAAAAVPLVVAALQRNAERRREGTRVAFGSLALWLAASLAALASGANLALAANVPFAGGAAPLGVMVGALALAFAVLESAGTSRAPARLVGALAAAIVGVAMATGDLRCLMVAAWCGAFTAGQASLRLDQARLLVPAVALSAIGYLFLPAPVRELAMQLRAAAAGQLGYAPERLPLSFYGISFLPYLGLLALLAWWFRRRQLPRHRRITSACAQSVAAGLAGMALLLGSDLRAPMAVLPADGLLLMALGFLGHSASAVFAGCLGVLGGIVCALIWFDVPAGIATMAGATAVLVLLEMARRPAAEGFAARLAKSWLAAALVAGVALVVWQLTQAWPPHKATPWNVLHGSALVPAFVLLRRFPGALTSMPLLAWLPLPVLWATATGIAAALTATGLGQRDALPFALAVVTACIAVLLPRIVDVAAQRRAVAAFTGGMFALQLGLVPGFADCLRAEPFAWSAIAGTAAMALASGALAHRAQAPVWLAVAVVEGALPLYLLAGASLGTASGPPGIVGPAALALCAGLLARRQPPTGFAMALLALVLAVVLAGWRLQLLPATPSITNAWAALLAAVLLAAQAVRLRIRADEQDWFREVVLLAVGVAALILPVAVLDLLVSEMPHYAIGFLAAAGIAFAAARFAARDALAPAAYGLWQIAVALVLAFVWVPSSTADHHLRLAIFAAAAALAAACRPRALRTASTVVALAGLAGAVVVQPVELQWIAARWWPVPMLGLCTMALAATAMPRWRARARAVRVMALVPVVGTAFVVARWATMAAVLEPARIAGEGTLTDAIVLAFLAAALALSLHWHRWGRHARWTAVALAACVLAPANALLHGHRDVWFRPDVEVALLALALAVIARRDATMWASVAGLIAAFLTCFEVQDVSTPAVATLLAAVPLVLLLRGAPGPLAWWHGVLLVASAWSWIAFAMGGNAAAHAEPWLALSAAAIGTALGPWLRVFHRAPEDQVLAAQGCAFFLVLIAVLARCATAQPLDGFEIAATLIACAIVAAGSGRAAMAPSRAPLVPLALAAVIAAYAALATGTELLAPLAGRHHHALTVLGATLFVVAGARATPLRQQWFGAAVALPFVGVLAAMSLGGLTFALLAGAAAYGFGAVLGRAPWLGALGLGLGNAGLFHLWLERGVFDPSFYGVPAGLSLVFGAELAARALGPVRKMALRVAGLSVLYGSVLVQVARVSAPLHALLLFALAMAAVAWGISRRQVPVLVAGVAAVVLDVIAYLAQRGFEQDFLGSVLLVGAGGTVFAMAARTARRRARTAQTAP